MAKTRVNILYLLTNIVNGKIYIGQTWQSLKRRFHGGFGYSGCIYLNYAIEKYGKDNFYYTNLDFAFTQAQANILEDFYIDKYDSTNPEKGYNIKKGGTHGSHSYETKKKLSDTNKGKKQSEETKALRSKIMMGNKHGVGNKNHFGHKHSDESKKKMSDSLMGREAWNKGVPMSEETKVILSNSLKGREVWNKGKPGPKGEDHPGCKLNNEMVLEIREDFANVSFSFITGDGQKINFYKETGKKLGLHWRVIANIIRRKTWTHI